MTIHQLQIFHVVCQELNYSIAAEKCYISRQALRQSIATLENELGGPLFVNHANHISLTQKGERLRQESAALIGEFERLEKVMQAENSNKTCIRFGISESLFPDYLPELEDDIESFAQHFTSLRVDVDFMPNDDLAEAVLSGALDCGLILDTSVSREGLYRWEISSHRSAIFCSRHSDLAQQKELSLKDLKGRKLCLPGIGKEFSPFTEAESMTAVAVPRYYQAFYFVAHDDYIGITRDIPKDFKRNDVVKLVPLTESPPLCCSFIVARNHQPVHLFSFRDYLKQRITNYFIRFNGTV